MTVFDDKNSSNDMIINDTMSDDEVGASDVPLRSLFREREKKNEFLSEESSLSQRKISKNMIRKSIYGKDKDRDDERKLKICEEIEKVMDK